VRVVAYVPDLLFGSTVVEGLRAAGHEPVLVGDRDAVRRELATAAVLVVDLTADVQDRIEAVQGVVPDGVHTLAFYSHVEGEVREQALQAGFDLVIPRSRMAREGVALVERLSG
jgi:nucleoside-diphosphate-sugar epimerase